VRNPQNYLHARIRVVGTFAGAPYDYEGVLRRILSGREPQGKRRRVIGPALVIELDREETVTEPQIVPTPPGLSVEDHVEQLKQAGHRSYVTYHLGKGKCAAIRRKKTQKARAFVPCGSITNLFPLDWGGETIE
jgi:hypothetical protein